MTLKCRGSTLSKCLIFSVFSIVYIVHRVSDDQSKSESLWNSSQHGTFLRRGVFSNPPNPQDEGLLLVGFPRYFIQYTRSYSPYWRPFFLPLPEEAPCCGDRDLRRTYHESILYTSIWSMIKDNTSRQKILFNFICSTTYLLQNFSFNHLTNWIIVIPGARQQFDWMKCILCISLSVIPSIVLLPSGVTIK
jgi:hypothetical protein